MTTREKLEKEESGFVLIGVVVFVLALTILGLSLFSLSGYEAQFLGRSMNDEQAFYFAMGGIERAKFALGKAPYRLDNVSQNLPLEGVTAAEAAQDQGGVLKTAGLVDWKGSNIRIRVTAQSNGVTRSLEGWYDPTLGENYYKRLITTSGGIKIIKTSGTDRMLAGFAGDVWERNAPGDSLIWEQRLEPPLPCPIRWDAVPVPAVADFIARHTPEATVADYDHSKNLITLHGSSNAPTYFLPPTYFTPGAMTLEVPVYAPPIPAPKIQVNGRVILLVPHGIRFDGALEVTRTGTQDCLVIVAGKGTDPHPVGTPVADPGIWFFGGIVSTGSPTPLPVILVSDGRVLIEQSNNTPGTSEINGLSIFASDVQFLPPDLIPFNPSKYMRFSHVPGSDIDQQIDWLAPFAALPNIVQSSDYKLSLVPDTWKELP